MRHKRREFLCFWSMTFLSLVGAFVLLLTPLSAQAKVEILATGAVQANALPLARAALVGQARFAEEDCGASTCQGRGDAFRSAPIESANQSPSVESARTSVGRGLPPKTLSQADTLLFTDQLGSLLSETDGNGTVQAEFAALPYGEARTNTTTQTEKYAGAPRDESVGLDQMGARFYAPALGMWTSTDPVVIDDPEMLISGEFATANPYAYANLNPTIAKDSDGNFWHVVAGAGIGAVFGGGMEAATQYLQHGEVKDWGRVGSAAAAGGAVSGALTAAAPGVGFAARALSSSASSVAGGMTTRAIDSGGSSVGSVSEIAVDLFLIKNRRLASC